MTWELQRLVELLVPGPNLTHSNLSLEKRGEQGHQNQSLVHTALGVIAVEDQEPQTQQVDARASATDGVPVD
jgi:hypothetical protein